MEAAVLLWFHLLLSVIFCNGFHVQGPSDPLTVQLGDSVMLPCFVETPLPMEELVVAWKRTNCGSLVHLWQNGESRPESQNQRYHERAHFFSEEVSHGNFSLLLTNVTREDAGVYKCVVHTNQNSDKTLIEIIETERLIVSGGHVISAYAGEEITLNCSVGSHIPSEKIEEVSWKKQDEDLLVLLYQEGEILTESTHGRFKGRVEFFSAEDRNKGNFSMRLKDVRIEDRGLYICSAFSGDLSDNTTVEVQQLGFSSVHIGIILLCLLGFVIGSVILGYFSYTALKKKDNSRRAQVIQCAHVLCPNIMMSIVFILWGVTEGFLSEAATCSSLNFVRILFLFWIAVCLKSDQDCVHQLMNHLAIALQYVVIAVIAYLSIIVFFWHEFTHSGKALILFCPVLWLLLIFWHLICVVCCRRNPPQIIYSSYINAELSSLQQIMFIFIRYGLRTLANLTLLLFSFLAIICFIFYSHFRSLNFFLFASIMMILEIANTSGSIYIHYDVVTDVNERDALICVTVFLHILTMMALSTSLKRLSESKSRITRSHQLTGPPESESRNLLTRPTAWSVVVFLIGSVLVVFVNVVALFVELILKTRTGQRTVDLRLIVIPTECVFAVCLLALQISFFWKKDNRETSQPNHDHEFQNLAPVSELSGS